MLFGQIICKYISPIDYTFKDYKFSMDDSVNAYNDHIGYSVGSDSDSDSGTQIAGSITLSTDSSGSAHQGDVIHRSLILSIDSPQKADGHPEPSRTWSYGVNENGCMAEVGYDHTRTDSVTLDCIESTMK